MYNLKRITLILLAVVVPSVANTNAALSMLILATPVFLFCLLPAIGIEALYISKNLELHLRQSLKTAWPNEYWRQKEKK